MCSFHTRAAALAVVCLVGTHAGFAQRAAKSVSTAPSATVDQPTDTLRVRSVLELEEVIRLYNPLVSAAEAEAAALTAGAGAISPLPSPMISLTSLPLPVHTARGEQQLQIAAEQQIPWPGKIRLNRELAELRADAVQTGVHTAFLTERRAALLTLLDLEEVGHIEAEIHRFADRLAEMERVATTRYEVGRGPQSAIIKSQVERGDLDLRLSRLQARGQAAEAALSRAVGAPVSVDFSLSNTVRPPSGVLDVDELLSEALTAHPRFQMLEVARQSDEVRVDRMKLDLRPDLTARVAWFSIFESDIPPSSDGRDALAIGLGVRIPLYRDHIRSSIEQARLGATRTEDQYGAAREQVRADLARLAAEVRDAEARVDLYTATLLPQAELAAASSLNAYENGSAGYLDLLDAERTLFRLRVGRVQARFHLLKQLVHAEERIASGRWTAPINE